MKGDMNENEPFRVSLVEDVKIQGPTQSRRDDDVDIFAPHDMINEADLKCAAKIFKADLMVQERDLTLGAHVLEALNVKRNPHTRRNRESKYPIANFIKTHFDVTSADPGNNSVMRSFNHTSKHIGYLGWAQS